MWRPERSWKGRSFPKSYNSAMNCWKADQAFAIVKCIGLVETRTRIARKDRCIAGSYLISRRAPCCSHISLFAPISCHIPHVFFCFFLGLLFVFVFLFFVCFFFIILIIFYFPMNEGLSTS